METRSLIWSARASLVVNSGCATFASTCRVREPIGRCHQGQEAGIDLRLVVGDTGLGRDHPGSTADERDGRVHGRALGDHVGGHDLGQLGRVELRHEHAVDRRQAQGRGEVLREELDGRLVEVQRHRVGDGRVGERLARGRDVGLVDRGLRLRQLELGRLAVVGEVRRNERVLSGRGVERPADARLDRGDGSAVEAEGAFTGRCAVLPRRVRPTPSRRRRRRRSPRPRTPGRR